MTAVFYDVVGSTTLLAGHDPEDVGDLIGALHDAVTAIARRCGASGHKLVGDGGCLFFGLPIPVERAAERAVSASQQMMELAKELSGRRVGAGLKIRVGVASGFAVVQERPSLDGTTTHEITGLAATLAARLQAEAEPGTILVNAECRNLSHTRFAYEPAGARRLRGIAEPVETWRVLQGTTPPGATSTTRLPLIGRADLMAELLGQLSDVADGRGGAVTLVGEPGVGKSRLLEEIATRASSNGLRVVRMACRPDLGGEAFAPFLGAIRDGLNSAQIVALATRAMGDDPVLSAALETVLVERPGVEERPSGISAGPEQAHHLFTAMQGLLTAWLAETPTLLLVDDLQWADSLSIRVLRSMADDAYGRPLLILASLRELTASAHPGDVVGGAVGPLGRSVRVSLLEQPAVTELLDAIWFPIEPPMGLASFVTARTGGLPLLVEATGELLRDRCGRSVTGPAEWEAALGGRNLANAGEILAVRLAGLPDHGSAAQLASICGVEFSLEQLGWIAGDEIGPDLDASIQNLVTAGVVEPLPGVRDRFRFRHVLLHRAAHDSALKTPRRRLHARLAARMRELARTPADDSMLAWHFAEAEQFASAAAYAVKSAERFAMRSATPEAEALLGRAAEYIRRADPDDVPAELRLSLLQVRGTVAAALFGVGSPQARVIYEEGVRLAATLGEGSDRWFPLYWGWWFTSPDFSAYRARAAQIVCRMANSTDPEVKLQAHHCAWATCFNTGRYRECNEHIELGLSLYDAGRAARSRVRYGGHDAKVCGIGGRGLSLWFQGRTAEGAAAIEAALAFAQEIGHRVSLAHALDIAAMFYRCAGEVHTLFDLARRMESFARLNDFPELAAKAAIFGGWATARLGSLHDGCAELERGLQSLMGLATREDVPAYQEMRAEVLAGAGALSEAEDLLTRTIEETELAGHACWLPLLYRRRALVRLAAARPGGARVDFGRALAWASEQEAEGIRTILAGDMAAAGLEFPA